MVVCHRQFANQNSRQFGYQVIYFGSRSALSHQKTPLTGRLGQVWMAHIALTDLAGHQHLHDQRFARGAAGLAGQSMQPFKVWLEDWQILVKRRVSFGLCQVANTDFTK